MTNPSDQSAKNADLADIVTELARRVEQLEVENRELRAAGAPAALAATDEAVDPDPPREVTRRRAIAGIGAAAAAAATVALTNTKEAAATTGQPVLQGQSNTFSSGLATTVSNTTGRALEAHGNDDYGLYSVGNNYAGVRAWGYAAEGLVATGLDIPAGSGKEGVVGFCGNAGYAGVRGTNSTSGLGVLGQGGRGVRGEGSVAEGVYGRTTANSSGVFGYCSASAGTGVKGWGPTAVEGETFTQGGVGVRGIAAVTNGVGGRFNGARAAINLVPRNSAGKPTAGYHARGDLIVDDTGKLFLCAASGTPGTWVRVNTTAV